MRATTHEWVIVGAGGFAREVAATIERWDANGGILMAVEPQYVPNPPLVGMYEVTTIADAMERSNARTKWILGIGDVALRQRLVGEINGDDPVHWEYLRCPMAHVALDATIAAGAYAGSGSIVSVGVSLGPHSLVNQCVSIGHDCQIGAHAVVCPGCVLSGGVQIGECAFLGSSVTVMPKVKVGAGASVAAGTVVRKNVPPNSMRYVAVHGLTMPIMR